MQVFSLVFLWLAVLQCIFTNKGPKNNTIKKKDTQVKKVSQNLGWRMRKHLIELSKSAMSDLCKGNPNYTLMQMTNILLKNKLSVSNKHWWWWIKMLILSNQVDHLMIFLSYSKKRRRNITQLLSTLVMKNTS